MAEANLTSPLEATNFAANEDQAIDVTFETDTFHIGISNVAVYPYYIEGHAAPNDWARLTKTKGQLHFNLLGKTWSQYAESQTTNQTQLARSNVRFQLGKSSRPKPNSRIAQRWASSSLHPISASVRNDLSAGQAYTCKVRDISIGGASLEFAVDPYLFVGQQTQIELHYPLTGKKHAQTIEVVSLGNQDGFAIVRVRFTPITSHHINSLANHLICFQFSAPPSKLELELENTEWPSSRIEIATQKEASHYALTASIQGENIVSVSATLEQAGKILVLGNINLSDNWSTTAQISSILADLFHNLLPSTECEQIEVTEDLKSLWFLGFRQKKNTNWVMPIASERLSNLRNHQRNSYVPASFHTNHQNPTMESAFKIYESLWPKTKKRAVSWDQYGIVYDKLCAANTSYQELLVEYGNWIKSSPAAIDTALDLGAGTGNFVVEAARRLPLATFEHIDQDTVMNFFAQEKYAQAGIDNVRITTTGVEQLNIQPEQFDLVTAIHSIYTLPNPKLVLQSIFDWLKPGGLFYVVDIGRTINTNAWFRYILIDTLKSRGVINTAKDFWDGRAAITQNKKIQATQDSGTYWNRSHAEFLAALETIGFEIITSKVTYRGNSDLAICRKPRSI